MGPPILIGNVANRKVQRVKLLLPGSIRDGCFVASEDDRNERPTFGVILGFRSSSYDILKLY